MGHSHDSARTLMRAGVFVLIVVGLVGCAGEPVKPFSDAADTRNLTHDQLVVWHQSNEQDEALANVGAVYDDPALQAYLQGVINRLYPQFEGAIRVHVLKSPVPNAFMMANGSCYVQLGLLALFDNEAQLAAVLGHEGGHFVRQHGLQMHEYAQNTAALAMVLGMVVPIVGPAMAVSSIYGYSREMEAEADSIGFERLKAAGYDVRQAIVPFELLDQYSQALNIKEPYFFADHPKLETRIQYYRAQAAITGQTSGYAGEKAYLTATQQGRLWVLQHDLSRQDYKSLIFFLGDPQRLAGYPPEARYYLGCAYLLRDDKGDKEKAEAEFRRCMQELPNFALPYEGLGKLQMKQHKNAEALTSFQKYLQLSPDAADAGYVQSYINRLSGSGETSKEQ